MSIQTRSDRLNLKQDMVPHPIAEVGALTLEAPPFCAKATQWKLCT
jgi:hypothetical protein